MDAIDEYLQGELPLHHLQQTMDASSPTDDGCIISNRRWMHHLQQTMDASSAADDGCIISNRRWMHHLQQTMDASSPTDDGCIISNRRWMHHLQQTMDASARMDGGARHLDFTIFINFKMNNWQLMQLVRISIMLRLGLIS